MLQYSYEEKVNALLETMWKVMVDAAEHPVRYLGGTIQSLKTLEQVDHGFIREIQTQGMAVKERVFFDEGDCIIRLQILEHPLVSEGALSVRAVQTSVQSPVAPVVLGMHLQWAPKVVNDKRIIDLDLRALLRRELQALKMKAEELEQSS